MDATPKQINEFLSRIGRNLDFISPYFYSDWHILEKQEWPSGRQRVIAATVLSNARGVPAELMEFDGEKGSRLWISEKSEPNKCWWKNIEGYHYENSVSSVMNLLVSMGYENPIPDNATLGLDWLGMYNQARKTGLLAQFPGDFLFTTRNFCLAYPERFKGAIMILSQTGCDLIFKDNLTEEQFTEKYEAEVTSITDVSKKCGSNFSSHFLLCFL